MIVIVYSSFDGWSNFGYNFLWNGTNLPILNTIDSPIIYELCKVFVLHVFVLLTSTACLIDLITSSLLPPCSLIACSLEVKLLERKCISLWYSKTFVSKQHNFKIKTSDKIWRRFDLSEIIFKSKKANWILHIRSKITRENMKSDKIWKYVLSVTKGTW